MAPEYTRDESTAQRLDRHWLALFWYAVPLALRRRASVS